LQNLKSQGQATLPEKLHPEVDKQIKELEELGFIKESKTPMVSPLICVIKEDKSFRCVIDFQYLNKYTMPDALGPPNVADVSAYCKSKVYHNV